LYMPVTATAYAAAAKVSYTPTVTARGVHLDPLPFHFLNVACHAAAAVALFFLLRRVIRAVADDGDGASEAAAMGALVFALHPIQVEAVAFAGALNNPLCGA